MPLQNAYKSTKNFMDWTDKEREEHWKRKEIRQVEYEDWRKSQPPSDGVGLKDNDGW